jgi:organic radical activating enzyme
MDELISKDGQNLSLTHDVLTDGWRSEWLANLRKDFLDGKKPASCYSCWTAEDAGIDSKRQRALRDFPTALEEAIQKKEHIKPKSMDLKLGNVCNNKCRICNSFASSLWVPEEKKRDGTNNLFWDRMRTVGRWPETNEAFWEDFEELSDDLEVLEFYGGEPLLIKRHYDILQDLVDSGKSKDIKLLYNTNGSIYPERGLELWPHFKQVMLSWSFDGVGDQFEYIRHPAKWNEVQNNLQKVLDKNIPNIFVDICYTVGIFNIFYMEEILEWRDNFKPDLPIYFNHVYTPDHFSCKVLPKEIKDKIVDKYKDNTHPDIVSSVKYCTDVDYDISLMEMFYKQVKFSDEFRGESFAKTFPEFYALLKQYGNAPEDF